MQLIDGCIESGIAFDQLCSYSVHEMGLFLKGVGQKELSEWKRTRRICFVLSRVMGAKIEREEELWTIDEHENNKDVDWDRIENYKKRLKELGVWSKN